MPEANALSLSKGFCQHSERADTTNPTMGDSAIALLPSVRPPEPIAGAAWVYVLQSADGALYVGRTCDLPERLRKHRLGLGSKYTHDHPGTRLIFVEGRQPLAAAVRRERQLKRWTRGKKVALILGDLDRLKARARRRT